MLLLAALGLLAAGCGEEHGRLDLQLDRQGCSVNCSVDRFDIYLARGGCLYAWRRGLGPGEQVLSGLELEQGQQVTVEVLGRCGNQSCVRCVARQSFKVGGSRVDLKLKPAASCDDGPGITAPCSACWSGSDTYCDGSDRISCPGSGQSKREPCDKGCEGGACNTSCSTIFYRDVDGDSHGDGAQQQQACSRPAGYADQGGDCDDSDAKVFPGQSAFFTTRNKQGTFDYNCDNVEEPQHKTLEDCRLKDGSCVGEGWVGILPFCGADGFFAPCKQDITGCSRGMPLPRKQACR